MWAKGIRQARVPTWKARLWRAVRGTQDPWQKSGSSGLREEDYHRNVSLGHFGTVETSPNPQRSPTEIGHRGDHLRVTVEQEIGT